MPDNIISEEEFLALPTGVEEEKDENIISEEEFLALPGKTTDPAIADPIVGSENTASNGEESSTESQDNLLTDTIMGASYQVSEEGIASGKKNKKAARNFFSTKKSKLEQALEDIDIVVPLTKKDIASVETDLQLAQSPKIKELEAKLKEVPSMSQEAADILKEIESIKSATTESRVNPRNKSYQKNIYVVTQHEDKVAEITNRVVDSGGDENEVKKQVDFYEKNNPEQTRVNTANYEIETVNKALDNISTAKTGDTYSSFSDTEEEATELNNLVEQQIIEDLSIKDMGKAAENNYTLSEKENIIRAAKQKVVESEYEKANDVYNSAIVVDFVEKKNNLDAQIKAMSKYGDDGLLLPFTTEEEANKYNNLVGQYNDLDGEREKVNDLVLSAKNRLETTFTELGFNAVDGTISNNFEMTDEYQEWRDKHVKERGFWGGAYDAVGTFVQEGVNIAADATVGTSVWLAGLMDETVNKKSRYYNGHDAIQDSYKNFANFNWAGTSDYGADILDKDGNYTINARSTTKTIANMLPFTIGVILSARSGNLKPAKSLWNTVGPKFLTSPKGRSTIRMVDASYRMTVNDNFHEGKDLGLDDSQSYAYSSMKSFGTGLSQMIMPDANFLGSTAGKTILKGFVSNLKNSATKKAIGGATKQFVVNMGKELGEEELELAFGDIAKYSVGLQHSPDILDLRTQKETIAATLMLSGSLGSIGTVNDIKNAKKQVYQQYKDNGQDIIDVLDDNLKVANAKFENARTQKSKDNHQATIDQINDAKNYGQSIINAVNSAPENVSDDQIDLLIQKQELVKQKQGKDKAISVGIDNQIKEIDEKISNSVIKQGEKAQTEKNIATVKQAIKKGGLDGNVSEMTSKEISDIKEEGFDSKSAAGQFGYIKQGTDGSFDIVLNKDKPMVGVESHEFMHAVLFKTVGNNKEIQDNLGDALIDHVLNDLQGDASVLGRRLSAYGKYNKEGEFIRDENFGEETITIMSESIVNGSLKFDENFFTKVGDVIRRFSQNYLGKEITFDTGRDVYNFIKDYSKNVKDGKINKAILKVAKEGAKGKLVEGKVEAKAGTQMAKDTESKTPEELVKVIKRGGNPKKVKEAEDALAPQFELLALSEKALNYDTRKGDIAREDVVAEAMTYLPGIVERFDPTGINPKTGKPFKFSTFVIANMKPKQQVIYEKVKPLTYGETTSIDTKEARQIEDTSSETTNTEKTFVQKINILQDFAIANRVADKIKALVKVVKGDNFKSIISKYAGKVGELIFEVPANKIMEGGANLTAVTKYTEGMPAPAEAQNIQRFFNAPNNADKFLKTLPLYNVTDKTADINKIGENIEVSRDTYGYAIGLKGLPLDYFYENYTDPKALSKDPKVYEQRVTSKAGRSMGLTSQTPMKRLKPQFRKPTPETVEQFKKDLGITPKNEANVYSRDIGQLLKGVAKVHSINAAISGAQRVQEAKLKTAPVTEQKAIKQQTADITTAQSKIAFSKAAAQINILSVFELETKGIDKLLKQYGVDGVFSLKSKTEIDDYIKAIKKDLLPLMPKEFWFGKSGGTVFTGSSKVLGTSDASKKLYKEYYEPAMKALANDAGVKFGADIKGVNDYSISSYKTIFKDTKTIKANIKNGRIKEWNKKVALIHEAMWFRMGDAIGKDKNKAKVIGNYMKMTGSDTKHWHKRGAQFVGYSVKPQLRYEYEHAMPATAAYLYLMDAALSKSDFKASYKVVKDNYKLMALDKAMDKKLTAVGLQRSMPKGWDLLENNWWDRYFNSLVAGQDGGINPSSIKTINGKTFGEEFNVNAEGNSSVVKTGIQYSKALNKAVIQGRKTIKESKGITVLDFDDTLATSKSSVLWTAPDGTTGKLTAEEFAKQGAGLLAQGYVYDFSEFNKVVKGKKAPLFEKALKLQSKFGPENMFILTARPAESAASIFEFVKANGLNIPLKNITGLANSTAESKALWMAEKVAEGYNDFYFADDALQNVKAVDNMLEQFDVKRKVQQARVKFSKSMNEGFNDILENVTGIESNKRFSIIKGRKRGASKGKFRFFVPPSHEDFVGLLYNFMGKGREGDKHRDFLEQALVRPLNRANREYDTARQSIANDYKELNKQFADVKKKLTKKTKDGDFTNEDAVRVYLWNKHGHKIPGLSPTDQTNLVELVEQDAGLKAYAETLNTISKQETYVNPTEGWNSGDIRMDLDDATGRIGRKQFFAEFNENADVVFSEENLNKIEAGYGKEVRESLEDILYRIQTGRNRPTGQNAQVNKLMNFLNGSVGTVMFFNMRSALLQQMSIVNYINFADNNIFAAAKAFANQKQYWADWSFIFNSDMLKQRRGGIQTDVNGAELAASLRNSKDITRKLISKLLELGFLPTQIGDNIAIATGGASYYRNRINTYLKQGLSQKEAEAKAFTDFQDITQATQQSARPDMVSKQQASVIGKVILNFQNVTSQFNRLGKKAFQDIYNRRITRPNTTQMQSDISNASRITYYFAVQNLIFYTLQTALFAMMFDDDEEDVNNLFLKKKERLINGSIDSVLRGTGLIGGVVATLKNVAIAFARQRDVKYNPDESAVIVEALNLSPVLGIKARQIVNAEKTLNYNKKVINEMETFDIDNPQWSAVTSYTQALTNLPLNRLYNKTQNVRQALNNEHSAWERSLMFLGWSQYNLDIKNEKMEKIKQSTKNKKSKGRGRARTSKTR